MTDDISQYTVDEAADEQEEAQKEGGYQPNVEAAVLNVVAQRCYDTSKAHGFQDDYQAAAWLDGLADYLSREARFTEDQTWFPHLVEQGDMPPVNVEPVSTVEALRKCAEIVRNNVVGTKLMLIVCELAEGMESLRATSISGHLEGDGNLGEELADASVRLGDTATMLRVALGDEQIRKMLINESRPHKHGKQL